MPDAFVGSRVRRLKLSPLTDRPVSKGFDRSSVIASGERKAPGNLD
jgi:hypothetical protein